MRNKAEREKEENSVICFEINDTVDLKGMKIATLFLFFSLFGFKNKYTKRIAA